MGGARPIGMGHVQVGGDLLKVETPHSPGSFPTQQLDFRVLGSGVLEAVKVPLQERPYDLQQAGFPSSVL